MGHLIGSKDSRLEVGWGGANPQKEDGCMQVLIWELGVRRKTWFLTDDTKYIRQEIQTF